MLIERESNAAQMRLPLGTGRSLTWLSPSRMRSAVACSAVALGQTVLPSLASSAR